MLNNLMKVSQWDGELFSELEVPNPTNVLRHILRLNLL